jgi:WD40 repeat protein
MKKKLCLYIALVITTTHCVAMEVERKSLASFFGINTFCPETDANQHIIRDCLFEKKWWYVDQEIQYPQKKISSPTALEWEQRGDVSFCKTPLKSTLSTQRRYVSFDNTGTQIISFPFFGNGSHYVWNREDGKFLKKLKDKDFCELYENDEWIDRFYQLGNRPGFVNYEDEVEKNLKEKFGSASTVFFKTDNIILMVRNFRSYGHHVYVWDIIQDKQLLILSHQGTINSVEYNPRGNEIITTSKDCTMRLWHDTTGEELLRIIYDDPVGSACFNSLGTEIVLATDNGKVRVLAQHSTNNLQQMLLKKLLNLWLQVKKPSKEIDSVEKLLDNVVELFSNETFCLDRDELHNIWNSFPENMKMAMWRTMQHKIQKYDKK